MNRAIYQEQAHANRALPDNTFKESHVFYL
jgi:hypothetical protein